MRPAWGGNGIGMAIDDHAGSEQPEDVEVVVFFAQEFGKLHGGPDPDSVRARIAGRLLLQPLRKGDGLGASGGLGCEKVNLPG